MQCVLFDVCRTLRYNYDTNYYVSKPHISHDCERTRIREPYHNNNWQSHCIRALQCCSVYIANIAGCGFGWCCYCVVARIGPWAVHGFCATHHTRARWLSEAHKRADSLFKSMSSHQVAWASMWDKRRAAKWMCHQVMVKVDVPSARTKWTSDCEMWWHTSHEGFFGKCEEDRGG